ncbi:MAG: FAD:protein FMN transferase [Gordonia sp. (in: high G+C Gram-positive bacteria)]
MVSPAPAEAASWRFAAIGTAWEITSAQPLPTAVRAEVAGEIDRIDRVWSRFRDDSVVTGLARTGGRHRVDAADRRLLDWYRTLDDLTDGAVTPLVGQILEDAGYDAAYSLRPRAQITSVPRWDDVIDWDAPELAMNRPALLDVGAAGKGHAVDRVAAIVADCSDEFIVDAGGDMLISPRATPVRIALEHPGNPAKAIGVVEMAGGAICASAPNRRTWAPDWHHIVDPRSAAPTWEVLATWAIADDAMTADGLATALFFTPAPVLRAHFGLPSTRVGIDLRTPTGTGALGPVAPGPGAGSGFHHVTIRRSGAVEHTAVPGLELFL